MREPWTYGATAIDSECPFVVVNLGLIYVASYRYLSRYFVLKTSFNRSSSTAGGPFQTADFCLKIRRYSPDNYYILRCDRTKLDFRSLPAILRETKFYDGIQLSL